MGSPHSLLPFNTVEAIEIEPDDPNLAEKLLECTARSRPEPWAHGNTACR